MKRITFKDKNRDRGLDTIVRSGTVVWTDESGVYLVDEECIQALEKSQIPYLRIKSRRTSERKCNIPRSSRLLACVGTAYAD